MALRTILQFPSGRLIVQVGDITKCRVDAIVNAANSRLLGGGGVDGAIHRAAGPALLQACRKIRKTVYPAGLPTGEAVMTAAGDLPSRWVIHTVGPVYDGAAERCGALLASCYEKSLLIAEENRCRSIAFPAVSTGVYGYPKKEAALVANRAVEAFCAAHTVPERVYLVFFVDGDARIFLDAVSPW